LASSWRLPGFGSSLAQQRNLSKGHSCDDRPAWFVWPENRPKPLASRSPGSRLPSHQRPALRRSSLCYAKTNAPQGAPAMPEACESLLGEEGQPKTKAP
jgi:hypothetical protein